MKDTSKLVIVVSGQPGAGSTVIAKNLAKRLGLRFFSPGFIQKGITEKQDNETIAVIESWKTEKAKSKKFHSDLDRQQMELAEKGGVVICGKLSIHFLPNADLKVWLDVSLDVRANRTAGRDNITFEEAHEAISSREGIERKEFKRIYGFDYLEQKQQADLVVDSSDMTESDTIEKIMDSLKKKGLI